MTGSTKNEKRKQCLQITKSTQNHCRAIYGICRFPFLFLSVTRDVCDSITLHVSDHLKPMMAQKFFCL